MHSKSVVFFVSVSFGQAKEMKIPVITWLYDPIKYGTSVGLQWNKIVSRTILLLPNYLVHYLNQDPLHPKSLLEP